MKKSCLKKTSQLFNISLNLVNKHVLFVFHSSGEMARHQFIFVFCKKNRDKYGLNKFKSYAATAKKTVGTNREKNDLKKKTAVEQR